MHFLAMNTPWIGSSIFAAPQNKMDDGYNDLLFMDNQTGGRMALIRILLDEDDGNYWQQNGDLRPEMHTSYVKATSWALDPQTKAEPPEVEGEAPIERDPAYQYNNNAFYSIDGERYKSQKISAKVLKAYLPIYV